MHMCVFTAAILLSFNLRAGGSSKAHDRTIVIVRLIDSLNEKKAEAPVRVRRSLAPKHDRIEHKKKATTALPKKTEITQEAKKETNKIADETIRQALDGEAVDTVREGPGKENPGRDPVMEGGELLSSSSINEVSPPLIGGDRGGEVTTPAEIVELIRSSIERAKVYPVVARKRGIEGVVYVSFRINSAGLPEDIKITRSSGSEILDRGAIRIIRRAGPFPYIESIIEVPISFRLKGQ